MPGNGRLERLQQRRHQETLLNPDGELAPGSHRSKVSVSSKALVNNFQALEALAPGKSILPMVKANAYGHGMIRVSKVLAGLPHLYALGVATLEEGREIREALGLKGRKVSILVFSGALPWTEEKGQFCERFRLTPVIASEEDWTSFQKRAWYSKIPYELKFNTGMNRLGIPFSSLSRVTAQVKRLDSEHQPQGVFSHLAMSESPRAALTLAQVEKFLAVRGAFEAISPACHFHLCNSGGIWNQKDLGISEFTDVVRSGLSLYGVVPWEGAPQRGIVPALTYEAQVIQVHLLKPGEYLGYGGTYRVPPQSKSAVRVGILGAGYADGLHRALSNQGALTIRGVACPILGRVSMDLCAVQIPSYVKVGDWAEIIGPNSNIWQLAKSAQTIPYELLTSISQRVERVNFE